MNYLVLSSKQVCEMGARVITTILQMMKLRHGKIVTGLKTELENGGARIQSQVSLASEPQYPNGNE